MATASLGSSTDFSYPPIHAFPPFYTLQHNPVSRGQQLSQWRSLILDYCRHHRIFSLSPLPSTSDTAAKSHTAAADPHKSLFANHAIQRALSPESIRQILAHLVEHKQAAWEEHLTGASAKPKSSNSGSASPKTYIYWKTPAQWGDAIYQWVMATGQNKSIMTLFELTEGDLVQGRGKFSPYPSRYGCIRSTCLIHLPSLLCHVEFYQLPTPLLRQALKHLSSQGKAQIFTGTEAEDGQGVKFV